MFALAGVRFSLSEPDASAGHDCSSCLAIHQRRSHLGVLGLDLIRVRQHVDSAARDVRLGLGAAVADVVAHVRSQVIGHPPLALTGDAADSQRAGVRVDLDIAEFFDRLLDCAQVCAGHVSLPLLELYHTT